METLDWEALMISGIGPMEIAIVLVIALVILGPKRLPAAAKSLGSGLREFKGAITGGRHEDEDERELAAKARQAGT
jgi:sec-independent protein translocase protein TatA